MSADLRPAENTSLIEPSSFERKANAIIADLRAGKMSKAHGLRNQVHFAIPRHTPIAKSPPAAWS